MLSLNVTNLCVDCLSLNNRARAFLTYRFKKRFAKIISRTGLNFNRATV